MNGTPIQSGLRSAVQNDETRYNDGDQSTSEENLMSKQVVASQNAPAAVGPYSQAIIANGFVFTAGQIPLIPGEGKLLEGDIQAQTHRVLQNLSAVLEAAGSSLQNVVKTTIFLASMDDYAQVNAVYAQYFTENPPARSTVQVAKLPLGAQVEIEVIATVQS
jgi:2-iminobutanoate/2-iminopropanoate deaminase